MKKLSLLLTLLLCLFLCACGKSSTVKNVESLIDEIGEVTIDQEDAVLAAEDAYAALAEEEKSEVENYSTLTAARTVLDELLYKQHEEELYAAISCEWINVNDADSYVFNSDGTGTHDGKSIEFTIDPENLVLSVTEGVSNPTALEFAIDIENETPRLTPKDILTYYVQAENYAVISQQVRDEYTDILTSYEYWSNTQGLNYVMFEKTGHGFFILSGITLEMKWNWIDNNTFKISFDYSGTTYSNVVTIRHSNDGPLLVNDQSIVQFTPKNKLN